MHETHLIKPIIEGINQHAQKEKARAVTKISLKVGVLTGIKEESFRETFGILAKGTLLEKAALEIVFHPGTIVQVLSFDIE